MRTAPILFQPELVRVTFDPLFFNVDDERIPR